MKTNITASILILVFSACIYIDIEQNKPTPKEVKTVYPRKEVKDWIFEDISNSKRLWLENVNNSTKK